MCGEWVFILAMATTAAVTVAAGWPLVRRVLERDGAPERAGWEAYA